MPDDFSAQPRGGGTRVYDAAGNLFYYWGPGNVTSDPQGQIPATNFQGNIAYFQPPGTFSPGFGGGPINSGFGGTFPGGNVPVNFGQDPGTFDPFTGGFLGGGGSGDNFFNTPSGQMLLNFGLGFLGSKLLGRPTGAERNLREFSTAGFGSPEIQRFLPLALRAEFTEPLLGAGLSGIADLLARPGGLSPSVGDAIRPRLAAESERIAQQFRGIGSNQQGAVARGNAPISIKNALSSALDIAQERAQRGARREALSDTDALRRQDLGQTFNLLDALLQFTSSGRGQAIQGLGAASNQAAQRQAAQLGLFGSLLGSPTT